MHLGFKPLSLLLLLLFIVGNSLAQQHLNLSNVPVNHPRWTMIGTNMIHIQDFDVTHANPVDSMCCGQKPSYLDRATVTIGFGLYANLNNRWALSGDLGISYGSIRSKTPLTSDGWKTWSQAARAEINYQLSDRGRLRPYVFSGVNGMFRRGSAYGTVPFGVGARMMSPNKEVMITSQLGYGLGVLNNLSNSVVFSLNVYVRMAGLGKRHKENTVAYVAPEPKVLRDTIFKRDTIWLKSDSILPALPEFIPEQTDISAVVSDTMRLAVYFDFDSYSLSKNSFEVLNAVVAHLKLNDKVQCILYGYTDQEGPMDYNQRLSISRANTARNYLMSYGIDGNRILVESFGKVQIDISNIEKYLAWKNRRVEIILIK